MGILLKSEVSDLECRVSYKEPRLELQQLEQRTNIYETFIKEFQLRLDDLKFNEKAPSGHWINFSKYISPAVFDLSFGLEEASARLHRSADKEQVLELYGKFAKIVNEYPLSRQDMKISQHFSSEEDVGLFLEGLNPSCPSNFKEIMSGRGVYYQLRNSEHDLSIYVTVVNSLFVPDGIFMSLENSFSPNKYDFNQAFTIAIEQRNFILNELGIVIAEEMQNG